MVEVVDLREESGEPAGPGVLEAGDAQLLRQLVSRAAAGGMSLAGEGGFLQQMTKLVLEAGLDAASVAAARGIGALKHGHGRARSLQSYHRDILV